MGNAGTNLATIGNGTSDLQRRIASQSDERCSGRSGFNGRGIRRRPEAITFQPKAIRIPALWSARRLAIRVGSVSPGPSAVEVSCWRQNDRW